MSKASAIKRCGTQTDMEDPVTLLKVEYIMDPDGHVKLVIENHPEVDEEEIVELLLEAVERLES